MATPKLPPEGEYTHACPCGKWLLTAQTAAKPLFRECDCEKRAPVAAVSPERVAEIKAARKDASVAVTSFA